MSGAQKLFAAPLPWGYSSIIERYVLASNTDMMPHTSTIADSVPPLCAISSGLRKFQLHSPGNRQTSSGAMVIPSHCRTNSSKYSTFIHGPTPTWQYFCFLTFTTHHSMLCCLGQVLPEYLKEAGYESHMIGKWHLGSYNDEYLPSERGFSSFLGYLNGENTYYTHTVCGVNIFFQR